MIHALLKFLLPTAFAQPTSLNPNTAACNSIFGSGGYYLANGDPAPAGTGFTCIVQYVANLTFVVIAFAAAISLTMLMINGFRYMYGPAIPGGSSDAAKKGIASALAGLALALLTYILLDTLICAVTTGPGQCFPLA